MNFFRYVAFEGIDASGKSTQAKLFCKFLKDAGYNIFCTKEPGGSKETSKLREILLKENLNPKAKLFLFLADRAVHTDLINRQLKKSVVVSDRSLFSTIAYQSFGEGLDRSFVEQSNLFATGGLLPDITFIIDIDMDLMHKRLTEKDVMESKGDDFFRRVKKGYEYIAENFDNVHIIDGNRAIDDIFKDIIGIWNNT